MERSPIGILKATERAEVAGEQPEATVRASQFGLENREFIALVMDTRDPGWLEVSAITSFGDGVTRADINGLNAAGRDKLRESH